MKLSFTGRICSSLLLLIPLLYSRRSGTTTTTTTTTEVDAFSVVNPPPSAAPAATTLHLPLLAQRTAEAGKRRQQQQTRGASTSRATTTTALQAFSTDRAEPPGRRVRKKKTLADRTQQEAASLIQDIVRAAFDAGPQAGPRRTLQAYRAVTMTLREYLPQLLPSATSPQQVQELLPQVLRTLFEKLGATYVKLGQFIASSPTLFPAEYVKEFQKCLDQTEPVPWNTIKNVIENELGPIGQTFAYIDETPLASASIAQVHAARLLSTGEQVVIKVQKPGIDECLQADLGFIYVFSRIVEFLQPDWERTSLANIAGDIRKSMLEELDFVQEAKNTIEFRRFLQDNGLLRQATAPRVYLDYTTKRVMVLERLNGVSLLDEETIRKVTNNPQMGTDTIITALNIWSLSITSMPWFHADVHAGNLLLLEDGRVGFIDFGIVGRISEKVFNSVNELSAALAVNDSEAMAVALCNMGAADEQVDTKAFGRDIQRVLDRMNNVSTDWTVMATETPNGGMAATGIGVAVDESEITDLLLELVEVTENNGLKLPREFGLLVKQSLYFDRYLKALAPTVDVMNDSRVMIGGGNTNNNDGGEPNGASNDRQVIDV